MFKRSQGVIIGIIAASAVSVGAQGGVIRLKVASVTPEDRGNLSIVLESGTTIRVPSSDVALPPARTQLPGIFPPDAFRNAPPPSPPPPPLMYWLKIGQSRISGPFESRSDCEQIKQLYERQGLRPGCQYE